MLTAEQSPLVYLILIMMSSIIILWTKKLWLRKVQDFGQGYAANTRHSQSEGRPRCQRMVLWLHLRFMPLLVHSPRRNKDKHKPQRTKNNLHMKTILWCPFTTENSPSVTNNQSLILMDQYSQMKILSHKEGVHEPSTPLQEATGS